MFQLPHDSRLLMAMDPANQWGWPEQLANTTNYLLEVLAWQKANEGVARSKQTDKPKLFVPPFMKNKQKPKDLEYHNTDDIKAILARNRIE
jgi:hypothetical protein